jgi:hypothetical protein
MPWVPQGTLLSHPKVRLFITHGGAGSVQEAICHKTPLLGIPLSNDQKTNLHDAQDRGIAHVIPWKNLSKEGFLQAIKAVLGNGDSSYQKAINRLSDLVMDQPMHPVERATWWMEYLLRHPKLEDTMRNPALQLSWWQYFMIDVFVLSGIVLSIVVIVIKSILKLCCCRSNPTKSKKE